MHLNPKLIVLISGKRKSGKDFVSELLLKRLGNELAVIVRLSAPIKRRFAEQNNLNYNLLLSDGSYKEQHREAMIAWGERVRASDAGYFCRSALELCEASRFSVWIVSDVRRRSDITWFCSQFGARRVRSVRVFASEETRCSRGFVFTPGVDDAESECDLDAVSKWDLCVCNDTVSCNVAAAISLTACLHEIQCWTSAL